jgi:hypothetical protein
LHAADALRAKDNTKGRTRKSPPFGFLPLPLPFLLSFVLSAAEGRESASRFSLFVIPTLSAAEGREPALLVILSAAAGICFPLLLVCHPERSEGSAFRPERHNPRG